MKKHAIETGTKKPALAQYSDTKINTFYANMTKVVQSTRSREPLNIAVLDIVQTRLNTIQS